MAAIKAALPNAAAAMSINNNGIITRILATDEFIMTGVYLDGSPSYTSENIRVYLRVRPFVEREDNFANETKPQSILQVVEISEGHTTVKVGDARFINSHHGGEGGEIFSFDAVGGTKVDQMTVFETVAKPIADNCLLGYNGTIFAYGQTGSGKTFTMQGPINEDSSIDYERRGVIPRTFEYLFQRMREEERRTNGTVSFVCKCAYVEIYNESIFDLLESSGGACTLREDSKKGVYVEGCREEIIHDAHEAFHLYEEGSTNKHVAETAMNRESSRSHCVFTITIQSKKLDGALVDIRESRFNLVDLAGSERQQLAATLGVRLKEAGNINKSLLALSNVINALVDIANGKNRHVHYRDSKLTFLLRDSLGGNSKTLIIATVSPSPLCQAETLSTLRFAQRAKQIRNKAIVNKDIQGNIIELQTEIRKLRHENLLLRNGAIKQGYTQNHNNKDQYDDHHHYQIREVDTNIWTVHYQRIKDLQEEIGSLKRMVESSQTMAEKREEASKHDKFLLKLRDKSIQTFENELVKKIQASSDNENLNLLEIFKQERARYKTELTEMKKQLENNPEATKFAHELLELRSRMNRLDPNRISEYEGKIGQLYKYADSLWEKLSEVEQQKSKEDQGEECVDPESEKPLDIHMQQVSLNTEKADSISLQAELLKTKREKEELEMRCNDLLQDMDSVRQELDESKSFHLSSTSLNSENGGKKRRLSEEGLSEDKEPLSPLLTGFGQEQDAKRILTLEAESEDLRNQLALTEEKIRKLDEQAINHQQASHEKIKLLKDNVMDLEAEKQSLGVELCEMGRVSRQKDLTIEEMLTKINDLLAQLGQWNRLLEFGSTVDDISNRIKKIEEQKLMLERKISKLEFDLQTAHHDNEDLLCQVQDLTNNSLIGKMAVMEQTNVSLHSELDDIREELVKLRQENDKLIQHRNIKQKLQYHVAIKEENNAFREEIRQLRDDLTRLRQRNIELEEALRS